MSVRKRAIKSNLRTFALDRNVIKHSRNEVELRFYERRGLIGMNNEFRREAFAGTKIDVGGWLVEVS